MCAFTKVSADDKRLKETALFFMSSACFSASSLDFQFRTERRDAALKDSVHLRERDSVVDNRRSGFLGARKAAFHFGFCNHAASAVNDERVFLQLLRKFCA